MSIYFWGSYLSWSGILFCQQMCLNYHQLQSPGPGGVVFNTFWRELCKVLGTLRTQEVWQIFKNVYHYNTFRFYKWCVRLGVVLLCHYISWWFGSICTQLCYLEMRERLKNAIKAVGGSINQSGLFLATTSNSTIVNKGTGINCRSVAFVPREKVLTDVLKELDKHSYIHIGMIYTLSYHDSLQLCIKIRWNWASPQWHSRCVRHWIGI